MHAPARLIDPVALTRDLIRSPSVTPVDAGAMATLKGALEALGFTCRDLPFEGTPNLYARRGNDGPNLCFAGHTDVVPTGTVAAWSHDPFAAEVRDGVLFGRGAVDMKGGIACWLAAVSRVLAEAGVPGSLSFLITGDEEGPALHGTKRVVEQLIAEGERIDACVVGEPSSSQHLGDMIKVGRRGSLNSWITVKGRQGHVAYPDRAANPVPVLVRLLNRLAEAHLDDGYPEFPPSNLEITTVDVGNPASNVIPAEATARLNIRFNPTHTGDALSKWLDDQAAAVAAETGLAITLEPKICVIPIDKDPTAEVACTPVKPMSTASRTIPPTVDVIPRPVNPTVMFVGEIDPTLDVAL